MTKQPTSFRLSALTTGQIADLARQTGLNQGEVVAIAIDRMHQREAHPMTPQYTIGRIACLAEHIAGWRPDKFDGDTTPLRTISANDGAMRDLAQDLADDDYGKLSAEQESDFWLGYYHERRAQR